MATEKEPGQDLAVPGGDFLVLRTSREDVTQIIKDNIGSDSLSEFDLDRVTVPTGGQKIWTVPALEGTVTGEALEGIIVDWANRRGYWPGEFKGSEPPVCSSPDGIWGYGDPGDKLREDEKGCEDCPMSAWGSDDKNRGQACKAMRQLFFLPKDSLIPIVVTLPPASLQNAKKFFLRLVRGNVHYTSVVTRLTLSQDTNADNIKFARVEFAVAEQLGEAEAARIREYADLLKPAFQRASAAQLSRDEVAAEA